jgi:hypothetical protein
MKTPINFELKTITVFEAVINRKGSPYMTITRNNLKDIKLAINIHIKDREYSLESLSEVETQEVV